MMSFAGGYFNSICILLLLVLPPCLQSITVSPSSPDFKTENDLPVNENSNYIDDKGIVGQVNNSSFPQNQNADVQVSDVDAKGGAVLLPASNASSNIGNIQVDPLKQDSLLDRVIGRDGDQSLPVQQQTGANYTEQQQQQNEQLPVEENQSLKQFILPAFKQTYFDSKVDSQYDAKPAESYPNENQKTGEESLSNDNNLHVDESKNQPHQVFTTKPPLLQEDQQKLSDLNNVKDVGRVLEMGNDDDDDDVDKDVQGYNDAGAAGQDLMDTGYEQTADQGDEDNVDEKINDIDNKDELEMEKNENGGDEFVETEKTDMSDFQWPDNDNTLMFVDTKNSEPVFHEEMVEYNMMKNRVNTPSSMVLFYTWVILIVLLTVIAVSAFKYRCKGRSLMNGFRSHRNGSYRGGDDVGKKLLENVYT
ncbi:putative pre-mRNA-splicing factor ATP-dependent RNA helicase DHX16 isoform X2 [Gigantopelta aegis]|uniref:putative pre-mRNA-splicing factor ATP-dependent RNA helicase DHX16 isoform X2 n=1 Tax=Gigantopelta aegis TaxID=1735272 RepID=UPI001B88A8FC|nr:putative pre-mRNA-splicing factor ATP-dependent RNA helicase DHX16 isoform X2 [Gigantopelta aegis]